MISGGNVPRGFPGDHLIYQGWKHLSKITEPGWQPWRACLWEFKGYWGRVMSVPTYLFLIGNKNNWASQACPPEAGNRLKFFFSSTASCNYLQFFRSREITPGVAYQKYYSSGNKWTDLGALWRLGVWLGGKGACLPCIEFFYVDSLSRESPFSALFQVSFCEDRSAFNDNIFK